jgi:hypothetical protein
MENKFIKHEVDRLCNVLVVLGWRRVEDSFEGNKIRVVVERVLPPELLKAAGLNSDLSFPK